MTGGAKAPTYLLLGGVHSTRPIPTAVAKANTALWQDVLDYADWEAAVLRKTAHPDRRPRPLPRSAGGTTGRCVAARRLQLKSPQRRLSIPPRPAVSSSSWACSRRHAMRPQGRRCSKIDTPLFRSRVCP